jgi:hypothetical protein
MNAPFGVIFQGMGKLGVSGTRLIVIFLKWLDFFQGTSLSVVRVQTPPKMFIEKSLSRVSS